MTQITRQTSRGQLLGLVFGQTDVAANQTDVQVTSALGEAAQANDGYAMPWDGEVVGVGWQLTAAATAGTGSVGATINGTEDADTTIALPIDSTTVKGYKVVPRGAARFVAGDVIGVELTTAAGWLPITTDLSVVVYVLVYLEGV